MEPEVFGTKPPIYFLGSSPSEVDDDKGFPFADKNGKLLRDLIDPDVKCAFDNVIRDYDHYREQPPWVAMECCRSRVVKSIETLKPVIVVGLGIQALQWMLNSSDLIGLRGRLFAVKIGNHACYFLPTYDPAYVAENAYEASKPLQSKLGHCLKFDIKRAVNYGMALLYPEIDTPQAVRAAIQPFNGHGPNQLGQVLKLISEARKAQQKAIDLETYPLRPYATNSKWLTCAISYDNTNFAFAIDHPKAGWSELDKIEIKEALSLLLTDETIIIAHNTPFEVEWLAAKLGRDVIVHENWECTMMQSHFIDERRGRQGGHDDQFQPNPYQALDFLVKQYFGISYKPLFKLNRKNMLEADLDETLIYNGADTKYTLRLFQFQNWILEDEGLLEAYREARERQPTVALMQNLGIHIDQKENKKYQLKLGGEIAELETQISELPEVKAYIKDFKAFNVASGPDLIRLLKDYIKVGKVLINDAGKESTDKGTLDKIAHPIGKLVQNHRNRSKLKSTYVDVFELGKGDFIWPDGNLHPSFNTTFAETGRTSCTAHWTPVVTARGEIPISEVKVGDLVWTHNKRWKPVTALWRKGWEVMLNLKLSNGSFLTCTKNHLLLNAQRQWITAGEIYELFQKMDGRQRQRNRRFGTVQKQKITFSETNSCAIENHRVKCVVGDTQLPISGGVKSTKNIALFNVQAWRQKSNEGLDWEEISSVEGSSRRWTWLQDYSTRRGKGLLPSLGVSSGFGATSTITDWLGNSSHRQQPSQQRTGQPLSGDQQRAQNYPLATAAGFEVTYVEEVEVGRSYEVFDITVADDASYVTCGVISHNSDEPNQQNWPSRNDKWVRSQVVAPLGFVLVAFDYGQLEACTGAMCSRDKSFVNALWHDYDIHMVWAKRAVELCPPLLGGSDMKKFRSLIKNKMVFPALFGAAEKSIGGYLLNATGVEMPKPKLERLFGEFWEEFSGFGAWQKRLMKNYYDVGFVESPTGRRRRYPLTKSQAINYPIQSVACDIVCRAMVKLSKLAAETGNWYLNPIMNIHDDLEFCIPDNNRILEPAIETIYKTMLTPGYDFINVPLSVSGSIGYNWYEMDEIGKFWSHRDA